LEVLLNQDEFGTNCAVDQHTKISIKIPVEIRLSADFQKVKYRPILSVDWSVSSIDTKTSFPCYLT